MSRAWIWLLVAWALIACSALARAQDTELVELRVTASQPGAATVDHGSVDGLALGDHVLLRPREGGTYEGTITQLDARSARIELADKDFVAAPGTRGEVRVPSARLAPAQQQPPAPPPAGAPESAPQNAQHPPWRNTDPDWSQGQPLLARIRPLRPSERPLSIHGRVYASGDEIRSSEDDRSDSFYRVGTEVWYDNLTGHGDRLQVEGEANYRRTDVPDTDDEQATRLRLDRLSYARGGTRFEPVRWELGRFLQRGMPEFGLLDGLELGVRLDNGSSIGTSLGFMPEPDPELHTGDDLQIAGFYRWVRDESEELSLSGGYQKTFHHLEADRDLFVGTVSYLPPEGWTLQGTAWVDLYGSTDVAKGEGLELTQLYSSLGRRWKDGSTVNLVYTHLAFPDIERDEFLAVTDAQLAEDHVDRLAIHSKAVLEQDVLVRAGAGAWVDQAENGYDGELGVGFQDLFVERSLFELVGFTTRGRFNTTLGGRVSLGAYGESSRWTVDYELAQHHLDGFSDDNDDLPQHRLRGGGEWHSVSGWSFSTHAELVLWDSEQAITLGFYLQRSF